MKTYLTNHSPLSASLFLQFSSDSISYPSNRSITIPAHQTFLISFFFKSFRVNPDYKKQITIVNLNNRSNELVLRVKANVVDAHGVYFHSLFYKVP